jgi:protein SCO1/2
VKAWLAAAAALALLAAEPALAAGKQRGAGYFPNVELTAHDGRKYRLYDDLLKGKTVAINVIFTECKDVCPLETAMLVQLYRLLGQRAGKDIAFYSISIDPQRDTPEVLKAYADKFGALLPGWLFLTGKPEDIRLATKKLGLVRATDKATRDGHTAVLLIGREPAGQWDRMSALDDTRFLATRMAALLGWRDVLPAQSYAEARPLDLKAGQYVYQGRCSACHSIGLGDKVGPDLAGVTARRGRAWLARYIAAPDEVLAQGDPVASALYEKYDKVRMPKLRFAPGEVDAVISYLDARTAELVEKAKQHAAQPHAHGRHPHSH